jgi:hypothetical protein
MHTDILFVQSEILLVHLEMSLNSAEVQKFPLLSGGDKRGGFLTSPFRRDWEGMSFRLCHRGSDP